MGSPAFFPSKWFLFACGVRQVFDLQARQIISVGSTNSLGKELRLSFTFLPGGRFQIQTMPHYQLTVVLPSQIYCYGRATSVHCVCI